MYLVYVDYYNVSKKCGDVKLIYLHDVPDIDAWLNREGFVIKDCYCVRATDGRLAERYLLADFAECYTACMFSKRAEVYAKGGYIDYIARMSVDFEKDIRRRALRATASSA